MNTQPRDPINENPSTAEVRAASGRSRRFAVLGVTAGLLGGGAIGLLAVSPSLSSAASATVADDTTFDTEADSTETDSTETEIDRPEPGARLRESLQSLVDDATLTAEQADAVAAHLAELRSEAGREWGGRGGARGGDPEVLASLLGIDTADIRTAIQGGSTIADIAEANGVDIQTVIDGLVSAANVRIDAALADGKLTEEDAAAKRAELVTRITEMVNNVIPAGGGHQRPRPIMAD